MLTITDISVRIAGRLLIEHSSVQIAPGARVGFIGPQRGRQILAVSRHPRRTADRVGYHQPAAALANRQLGQEAPDGPES
jgi:ATP-binding cassette subfamily F protein 3